MRRFTADSCCLPHWSHLLMSGTDQAKDRREPAPRRYATGIIPRTAHRYTYRRSCFGDILHRIFHGNGRTVFENAIGRVPHGKAAVLGELRIACGFPGRMATFAAWDPAQILKPYLSEFMSCIRSHATISALTPPPPATLSVLPGGSLRSPGKKATFADARSSACGYAVRFARRIACGSPGKKTTFAGAHSSACGYAVRFARRIASLSGQKGNVR